MLRRLEGVHDDLVAFGWLSVKKQRRDNRGIAMTDIVLIIAQGVAFIWSFWGVYVLVMGIYRAYLNKNLRGLLFLLSFPFVVLGYFIDVFANITIASAVFMEFPRELLVTSRLKRYVSQCSGWRCRVAKYICDNILDPFDPRGEHC